VKAGISGEDASAFREAGVESLEEMVTYVKAGIKSDDVGYYIKAGLTEVKDMVALLNAGVSRGHGYSVTSIEHSAKRLQPGG
jgi:hypothetical protein